MTSKCGFVYDEDCLLHAPPVPGSHYEVPARVQYTIDWLQKSKLLENWVPITARNATFPELLLAHSQKYLTKLLRTLTHSPKSISMGSSDMYANDFTMNCVMLAAGCATSLVERIVGGKIDRGIAFVRPPGHHAFRDQWGGFCYINNVAVATLVARNSGERVFVLDWDVHEGNGTRGILGKEPNVFFTSIHRSDNGTFYPGKSSSKTGKALPPNVVYLPFNGSKGDDHYITTMEQDVVPLIQSFQPTMIIVSCGFDAARGDPIGGCEVSPWAYGRMTEILVKECPRVALILEGGYNEVSVCKSSVKCMNALSQV